MPSIDLHSFTAPSPPPAFPAPPAYSCRRHGRKCSALHWPGNTTTSFPFCFVPAFVRLAIVFDHPRHKVYQPLWHIAITKANKLWRQYRHTIRQNQQQPGLSIRAVAHVVGVAVYPSGQNGGFAFTSLSRAVSAASVYPPAAMRTLRRLLSELRARRFAGIHRAAG